MTTYEQSLQVLSDLFAKDYQFALATSKDNVPSVRFIDTYYDNGSFYIVTYRNTRKVQEIDCNEHVSLCNKMYGFSGIAHNIGHPLKPENSEIRSKLIEVFAPWYFAHNNEDDENMCYVKVELTSGFFYQNGTGYKVDFTEKTAQTFPFSYDIVDVQE